MTPMRSICNPAMKRKSEVTSITRCVMILLRITVANAAKRNDCETMSHVMRWPMSSNSILEQVQSDVREAMRFHLVSSVDEVLVLALEPAQQAVAA